MSPRSTSALSLAEHSSYCDRSAAVARRYSFAPSRRRISLPIKLEGRARFVAGDGIEDRERFRDNGGTMPSAPLRCLLAGRIDDRQEGHVRRSLTVEARENVAARGATICTSGFLPG